MSKAAIAIVVVLSVLAGCLIGIPIGYIVPKVYEKNFVPTPSKIFAPVDITLEELRQKDPVTVQDIASFTLTASRNPLPEDRLKVILAGKNLEAFDGSVATISALDTGDCVMTVHSDDYPAFTSTAALSGEWCSSLGINSKVVMSGIIEDVLGLPGKGLVSARLKSVGLSVR